jgi:hypothetical protein
MKTDHFDDRLRRNQNSLLMGFMDSKFRVGWATNFQPAAVRNILVFLAVGVLFPDKFQLNVTKDVT